MVGHAWIPGAGEDNAENLNAEYITLARETEQWRAKGGISGFVYKQYADAGEDCSGLVTGDHEVIKLDLERVTTAAPAGWPSPRIRMVVPTGRAEAGPWRYTTTRPATDDWSKPAFDASAWTSGAAPFAATAAATTSAATSPATAPAPAPAVRTAWAGGELWTRRSFVLDTMRLNEPLAVFRGRGDVELFLNGQRLAERRGLTGARYEWLRAGGRSQAGANVLGVHARAEAGNGLLDVGLLDLLPQRDIRLPVGLKPILNVWMRDPCVCLGPDGVYYLVGTGTTGDWKCDGIPLYRSADLKKWEFVNIIVHLEQFAGTWVLNARKNVPIWAPELHHLKGAYWLTFCTGWADKGSGARSGTGLLKSTTGKVEGPYELVNRDGPITPGELDASLFQDDDGTVYFLSGGASIARMTDDMTGLAEKRRDVAFRDPTPMGFEGIFMFKAGGRYYVSNAGAPMPCKTYDCMVAMADKIEGPYTKVHIGVPHGGHNMFFKDKAGQWWSTIFGGDQSAPFIQMPGLLRVEFAPDGTIHPLEASAP